MIFAIQQTTMEDDFEDTSQWAKEGWVKKFREIWRSPEDMKERLHHGLQLYFSSPHLHLTKSSPPDSSTSSPSSSSPSSSSPSNDSSTSESVSRLLYLWTEIRHDHLLALEIAKAFEAWVKQSTGANSDAPLSEVDSLSPNIALIVDDESRAKALHLASLSLHGSQIPALYEALFQFTHHKDELKLEIDRRLEQVSQL